jgi:hypothetical protein
MVNRTLFLHPNPSFADGDVLTCAIRCFWERSRRRLNATRLLGVLETCGRSCPVHSRLTTNRRRAVSAIVHHQPHAGWVRGAGLMNAVVAALPEDPTSGTPRTRRTLGRGRMGSGGARR